MQAAQMLLTLKASLAKVERISTEHADRLLKLLDAAPAEALEMLVREKVNFCYLPAMRRLREKHGYSKDRVAALLPR